MCRICCLRCSQNDFQNLENENKGSSKKTLCKVARIAAFYLVAGGVCYTTYQKESDGTINSTTMYSVNALSGFGATALSLVVGFWDYLYED